jgi:two-component system phosphate regulon sensor histidine kinase PhoR
LNAGVRLKLFAIALALVVGVGLVSGIYMEGKLRAWLMARIESELLGQARLARDLVELLPGVADDEVADRLADRLGASSAARVTVVGQDGAVVGDSGLSLAELRHVENHGHRPEVEQALAEGHGAATRYSTSVRADMFYVAVPFQRPDMRGVVRVAMPLSEVD